MALGGGVFVTQNKTLPGSYINFVNASNTTSTVGERGVVAYINTTYEGEYDKSNYPTESYEIREMLCHANKVYAVKQEKAQLKDSLDKLEQYNFNILVLSVDLVEYVAEAITRVKSWRDDLGKKCQMVLSDAFEVQKPNHEGIIVVVSTATIDKQAADLSYWVAGAMAGCKVNESCTNMLYDGELTVVVDKSQSELEECIKAGQVVFHNVYGEVRLLEDVNSLTETSVDKGEDFKSNQTIRVIDQIANDIAKLFNTKYLGKIPNNASGRVSLWADIVNHHRQLESIQAIENFDATLLTVEQGNTKKSVVINDVITVTNAMAQLYMTVVVQ